MLTRNEQENRAARDKMANEKRLSFQGIYFIGLAATTIGIGVIVLLNLATPLEYLRGRLAEPDQEWYQKLHHILNLAFLLLISCPLLLLLIRRFLRPLSEYVNFLGEGQETEDLIEKARQTAINLPFILIPLNLGLWILLPSFLYFAAYVTGNLDWRTAIILAIRAIMVGFISAGIMSLWVESYVRDGSFHYSFPGADSQRPKVSLVTQFREEYASIIDSEASSRWPSWWSRC